MTHLLRRAATTAIAVSAAAVALLPAGAAAAGGGWASLASGAARPSAQSSLHGFASATGVTSIHFTDSPDSSVDNGPIQFEGAPDQIISCQLDPSSAFDELVFRVGNQYAIDVFQENPPVTSFGNPDDEGLCGDWDGDGTASIGVHRGNTFYLSNDDSTAFTQFVYGDPGDQPVVGDFDGDGRSDIGVHRANTFYLSTSLGGPATHTIVYGDPGDTPLVGDFDGDGTDTVGVHRSFVFYLSDNNATAAHVTGFGDTTDTPLIANTTDDAIDDLVVTRYDPNGVLTPV
jgi:hypothetical protein